MERGRAYRRHQAKRRKARARRTMLRGQLWGDAQTPPQEDPDFRHWLARRTDRQPCSCWLCRGHLREQPHIQDRRRDLAIEEA